MVDGTTTFVPYSLKVHCMASIPRDSPGFDVARWILGRLSLQLLPLVSNKHPISHTGRTSRWWPRRRLSLPSTAMSGAETLTPERVDQRSFTRCMVLDALVARGVSSASLAARQAPAGDPRPCMPASPPTNEQIANSPFFHLRSGSRHPHAGLMHHTLAAGIAGFSSTPGLGLPGAEPPRLGA